jgi:hypothetical protein
MGHLVQQCVAAGLKGFEGLVGLAPAAVGVFLVALGVESVLRLGGGEEQGADLHLGVRPVVLSWSGIGDGETGRDDR